MEKGSFVLVLHGHLPYVLRHGSWPHGEDWLYEAAAETYLPLLDVIGHCLLYGVKPKIVVGLTPVLLEQLAHESFRDGFRAWLRERAERARTDRAEFVRWGHGHLAWLADRWEQRMLALLERFEELGCDLPAAFAEHHRAGAIQILTSAATHGYLPLLGEDASVRAQVRAGIATTRRVLGIEPTGVWLPECAYRPCGEWSAPRRGRSWRAGIEHWLAEEGITHTFVEHHLVGGWRVHEPYRVGCEGRLSVFGRDPVVCEKVWSGAVGYPADGRYLEFHKKHGERGLRYWKITGPGADLGDKHLYYPDDVPAVLHAQARHFCDLVRARLRGYHQAVGSPGVLVATFDAELFGHWWAEGPKFLEEVVLTLAADPEVGLSTAEEVLRRRPPAHAIDLPEGSWGVEGDHRVWSNDRVQWMWDVAYRCEASFGRATDELPWTDHAELADLLRCAGRELLLLQSSDWIFAISRGQAVDYGIQRFVQHVSRFDTWLGLAERTARGTTGAPPLHEAARAAEAAASDVVFPDVDLGWWQA